MTSDTRPLAITPVPGSAEGYRYLNTGAGWPLIRPAWLNGLVMVDEDKALQLAGLPGNAHALGPSLPPAVPPKGGTAGIAVDADENVYVSDLALDLIQRIDGCDGKTQPLRCLGGTGSEPGRLNTPRGLAVGPRGWLYVADSGNHRIQVVDIGTLQLRAVWGPPDPGGPPQPGDAAGRFNDPWDVAIDATGDVYVADRGNNRVQKFDANGRVLPAFWETMQAQAVAPQQPISLATMGTDDDERLLVVGGGQGRVFAYRLDGTYDADTTALWQAAGTDVTSVVVAGGLLFAGDSTGRLHVLAPDGTPRGEIAPFVAGSAIVGIAVDCQGRLLVRQAAGAVIRLEPGTAHVHCGTFLAGPLSVGSIAAAWQRVSVVVDAPTEGANLRLFTLSSDQLDGTSAGKTPALPAVCAGSPTAGAVAPEAGTIVPLDTWRAAPADDADFLALNQPGRYFWVAGILEGTGSDTPRLSQLRVDFNHDSWMRYLPAMYRRGDANPSFAEPAMLLLESVFDDLAAKMDALPRLFDPAAAPDDGALSSWLDWLGGWLAVELQEDWPEDKRRYAVARAFAAHAKRGTVESLKQLVELYAGVSVQISEPALSMRIWSLGETSTLGFETMLASAHADGAIVGSTSTLGQSHLISEAEYGAPLFDAVAHRFCVGAYAIDMKDATTASRLRAVLDREKPAHTTYELCLIDALMRVGVQAQIGVDTIIGEVTGEFETGVDGALGYTSILPPLPANSPTIVGKTTSLGRSMTIV